MPHRPALNEFAWCKIAGFTSKYEFVRGGNDNYTPYFAMSLLKSSLIYTRKYSYVYIYVYLCIEKRRNVVYWNPNGRSSMISCIYVYVYIYIWMYSHIYICLVIWRPLSRKGLMFWRGHVLTPLSIFAFLFLEYTYIDTYMQSYMPKIHTHTSMYKQTNVHFWIHVCGSVY